MRPLKQQAMQRRHCGHHACLACPCSSQVPGLLVMVELVNGRPAGQVVRQVVRHTKLPRVLLAASWVSLGCVCGCVHIHRRVRWVGGRGF